MTQGSELADWLVSYGTQSLEVVGTLAFALSGLIEAARKRLDVVGMAMVTFLAAFGGGTIRDILLDRRPFFWVENSFWLWAVLAPTERATAWPDAFGLGVFAAGGTQIALAAELPAIVAVIMGVITAVVGGVLRDVVVNEIPRAFVDHQPYSVLAFTGSWVVVGLNLLGWPGYFAVAVGAVVIIVLRICAMVFGWRLPSWRV
jgi:uncharacterized membrane protein YeiH